MNYYELIYLKNSLEQKVVGSKLLQVVTPHKNVLEFHVEGENQARIVFSASPDNTALFLDTPRPSKKKNALTFFDERYGTVITGTEVAENDRWLTIFLEGGYQLQFRLFSHKSNVLLIHDGVIAETFKDYDKKGRPAPKPRSAQLFEASSFDGPKDLILQLNPMFPRDELELFIEVNGLEQKNKQQITEVVRDVHTVLTNRAIPRILVTGDLTLMPEDILPVESDKIFESVNDLIAYRYKTHSKRMRVRQQKGQYLKAIKRKQKRIHSSLKQLQKADKGLAKAERYEQLGHLLMANAHLRSENANYLQLQDLYDDGNEVRVDIDPKKSISANAEEYYRKARQSLASYKQAEERIPELKAEQETLEGLKEEFEAISDYFTLQEWLAKNELRLQSISNEGGTGGEQKTSPFHILQHKNIEIWIGKNARSNDSLLRSAHKEDVWLHARGVPGSHVVIRMSNNKEMPSSELIAEAASYAAYYSKARGSALVPVIFTKCKYVRKPKGAAPGAVLVQKENVEMVEPVKPKYE